LEIDESPVAFDRNEAAVLTEWTSHGEHMKEFKFKAKIEAGTGGGAFILFPYGTQQEFGTKAKIPVKATIDGIPYSGSLVKYGHPQHMLGILKSIREQLGKKPGDTVEVVLHKDNYPRTVEVPDEFHMKMKQGKVLLFFETLSYTHRKEYCRWITGAKKEETRQQRLEEAIKLLRKGMKTPLQIG